MEWHRHRIHPLLWQVLEKSPASAPQDPIDKELQTWRAREEEYLARRPQWSQVDDCPPWDEA